MTPAAFIARETAVSTAVNAAISAGFCWLVFGGDGRAPVWGAGGLVVDYLPQGFMVGLMGALVPGLLGRRARATGRVEGLAAPSAPATPVLRRSFVTAMACAAGATAVAAVLFRVARITDVSFATALALKTGSGALIALVVTPPAIRAALSLPRRSHAAPLP